MKKINPSSASSPFVTKEVPKLRGSRLSIKLKLKIAITSFFSTVMSLHLGSPRLHMRSHVPGGSGKFGLVRRSPNTLGNFLEVIYMVKKNSGYLLWLLQGIGTSVGGF